MPSVVESETAVQSAAAICRPGARTRVNRGETRFDPFRRVSPDATLPYHSKISRVSSALFVTRADVLRISVITAH